MNSAATTPVATTYIRFGGWATIRLPTDPDPADEKRGASGYTFAFAGEPDLDRVIRFQPQRDATRLRGGAPWTWGVNVTDCFTLAPDGTKTAHDSIKGAAVDLLGEPKLENRNWLFTLPGWEPVYPFEIAIEGAQPIRRRAPLTTPEQPIERVPTPVLMAQGASGANMEPETIGTATGIWSSLLKLQQRRTWLEQQLVSAPPGTQRVALEARLRQVRLAVANPTDRRVVAHYAVERFFFPITGASAVVPAKGPLRGLDPSAPWMISYWFGAWDFDLLGVYAQGCLSIPHVPGATHASSE